MLVWAINFSNISKIVRTHKGSFNAKSHQAYFSQTMRIMFVDINTRAYACPTTLCDTWQWLWWLAHYWIFTKHIFYTFIPFIHWLYSNIAWSFDRIQIFTPNTICQVWTKKNVFIEFSQSTILRNCEKVHPLRTSVSIKSSLLTKCYTKSNSNSSISNAMSGSATASNWPANLRSYAPNSQRGSAANKDVIAASAEMSTKNSTNALRGAWFVCMCALDVVSTICSFNCMTLCFLSIQEQYLPNVSASLTTKHCFVDRQLLMRALVVVILFILVHISVVWLLRILLSLF